MQTKTDAELLGEYAKGHSEAAFGEIVRRYTDTVYSAALRQVGNDAQARDVAQTVFIDLARKAASLGPSTVLIGWLHRGTRLAVLELLRNEQRRLKRERRAMEIHESSFKSPDDWNAVHLILDEAIANLSDEDRNALLLRFFKNQSLASVGAILGVSEDAAQKRVSRSLGKLRDFFARRGINTTTAALSAALATNAVQAAPTGLAASLAVSTLAKAAAVKGSAPLLSSFTALNMKTLIVILPLAGGLAGLSVLQIHSQRQLQEARELARQNAEEILSLRAANEQLASLTNEAARWRGEARENPALRAEVTRLRQEQLTQSQPISQPAIPPETQLSTNSQSSRALIKAEFVTVPTEALKALNSTSLPYVHDGVINTLTEGQFKVVREALEGADDVNFLGKPQILTPSGAPASISMTKPTVWGSTNVPLGLSLDVKWELLGSAFSLELKARLTELVNRAADQDSSQTVLQTYEIPANVTLPEGQTLVLAKDIAERGWFGFGNTNQVLAAAPETLLIFVTPSNAAESGFSDRLATIIQRADTNAPGGKAVPNSQATDTTSASVAGQLH